MEGGEATAKKFTDSASLPNMAGGRAVWSAVSTLDASMAIPLHRHPLLKPSGIIRRPWCHGRKAMTSSSSEIRHQEASTEGMLDHQTDEALLGAYREGDREAFSVLVERYSNELVQFLTKQTGSRAAAEDVFQETFLQVHNSASTFDLDRRFKPWLYTIAVNKGRDWHRRNARRKAMSLSANVGKDGDGQSFADLMPADIPGPSEGMQESEMRQRVKHVVDSLPGHYREILLLSYFQKMSYTQIAETLEIPLGTVKSRLHSAVAAFGTGWDQDNTDTEEREE